MQTLPAILELDVSKVEGYGTFMIRVIMPNPSHPLLICRPIPTIPRILTRLI